MLFFLTQTLHNFHQQQQPSGEGQAGPEQAAFNLNQAFQDHDWSFDNLDEIVAIAIKAEFNTFDLADLTNDVVTVKEELAGMPMAVPQANAAAAASTSASEGTFSACGVFCSMICTLHGAGKLP